MLVCLFVGFIIGVVFTRWRYLKFMEQTLRVGDRIMELMRDGVEERVVTLYNGMEKICK